MPARRSTAVLLTALSALSLLGGCGSDESDQAASAPASDLRVGLVTDTGGVNDRSFNSLAVAGLRRAERELGVDGTIVVSKTPADYVPNLEKLGRADYDLVIGVGFLIAEAMDRVAARYPDTRFAVIDYSSEDLKDRSENIQGSIFDERQAGYLAGYLAGLVANGRKYAEVSAVGGERIPPVEKYIVGYRAGIKAVNPAIKVRSDYSESFTDEARCREIADRQIAEGSKIVFQVAGKCGLGALAAAKAAGAFGIGVDADQSYLGDFVLTSAVKEVDNAVFDTVKGADEGAFLGGSDLTFGLFNQGVGLGRISPAAAQYERQLADLRLQLISGNEGPPNRKGR